MYPELILENNLTNKKGRRKIPETRKCLRNGKRFKKDKKSKIATRLPLQTNSKSFLESFQPHTHTRKELATCSYIPRKCINRSPNCRYTDLVDCRLNSEETLRLASEQVSCNVFELCSFELLTSVSDQTETV